MAEEFIGAGLAFPLRVDASGALALVTREQEIEEAIRLIIGTSYGERPMRPEFGCGLHDFVFAPSDAGTAGRIAYEVRVSLERWEPRIDVRDVQVRIDADDRSRLMVDITWCLRGSNDPRNLVYPFYVLPEE